MKKISLFVLFLFLQWSFAVKTKAQTIDGYPVANFALTVNASESGDFYGHIFQNPGKLGQWLANKGKVSFQVEKNGKRHLFSEFQQKKIDRSFPFVKNAYSKSSLISSKIDIQTFCPLGINDLATSSLPVLLLELTCTASVNENFELIIKPDSPALKEVRECKEKGYSGIGNATCQITADSETQWKDGELRLPVSLKAHEKKTLHILLSFYDNEWISVNDFQNISEISDYTHRMWDVLKEKTRLFSEAIPETGDKELDKYLRWYMIPGISLTKCTKENQVLTMGYCELNQRDSYWTSWLHLVLFKDVERKMIEESIQFQQPSGKIPTTILPLIERNDDLDINAFFILRVSRFYKFYHDKAGLKEYAPALNKAMDWLISRDTSGDGLPAQISFWGDWKDVKGIEGRKYSPFSGLIYLAALKEMVFLSQENGDETSRQKYESAYKKGYEFINKPVKEGGLWNGDYYCQIWKDGQVNDKLLQDQTIGVLFGVVSAERSEKIIQALNTKSLTAYGIAETFPYYPKEFGYAPATYHNGAVWPWLSFMDCWSRIRIGKKKEAIDLVKKVAHADLVASGDWSPNEHINSLSGENLGFQLQGWNAGLFGLVYFGIVQQDRVDIP
jgi:uncharacterized protein (DUF608 family)